ncbi:superoxide dismutase family protein [Alcaligenaceae bacterium]|nr:superoxide dismutase family protein [Alcaligenaceae bacterium]
MVAGVTVGILLGPIALAEITVPMHQATEKGLMDEIGQVVISESKYGLVFTPQLKGLEPGVHGFHLHEKPSCEPAEVKGKMTAAGAAGGHLDPDNTGAHGYPWGDGHLGDLPALYVDAQGAALHPVLAPRLTSLDQIAGRALMVHKGGDNHADQPKPLGGGGAREACGVIKP